MPPAKKKIYHSDVAFYAISTRGHYIQFRDGVFVTDDKIEKQIIERDPEYLNGRIRVADEPGPELSNPATQGTTSTKGKTTGDNGGDAGGDEDLDGPSADGDDGEVS